MEGTGKEEEEEERDEGREGDREEKEEEEEEERKKESQRWIWFFISPFPGSIQDIFYPSPNSATTNTSQMI